MTPSKETPPLIDRNRHEDFHNRFVMFSSAAMGVFILMASVVRNLMDYPASKLIVPYFIGSLCVFIALQVRRGRPAVWHTYAIVFGVIVIAINGAIFTGGLRAPAVLGLLLLPMFTTTALGRWGPGIGYFGAIGSVAVIMVLEKMGYTAPLAEGSLVYLPIIYSGIMTISLLIISAYEKARVKNENAILKMNEQLISSAKLSSLGEMASGVAHEINNPLAVIQAKTGQIRRQLESPNLDYDKLKQDTLKIEQTVERIAKIVRGLYAFSRNSDGDPFQETSVMTILTETLELCHERFKTHQVRLSSEGTSQAKIKCRPAQISQVIMNLLSNSFDAVQALPEHWVRLEVKDRDSVVEISVVDSGAGIPDAVSEKMLEPFFTTKPVGKGTGLGLSISRGLIEEHGGTFEYDKSCKNTRFVITLPIAH